MPRVRGWMETGRLGGKGLSVGERRRGRNLNAHYGAQRRAAMGVESLRADAQIKISALAAAAEDRTSSIAS